MINQVQMSSLCGFVEWLSSTWFYIEEVALITYLNKNCISETDFNHSSSNLLDTISIDSSGLHNSSSSSQVRLTVEKLINDDDCRALSSPH